MTKSVTDVRHKDITALLAPGAETRQSMKGFDDDFVDIVDYIVRITHRIWEEKNIGLIYNYYSHNAVIHNSAGLTYGREQVIADTVQALAAFPDRRLFANDVIWAGNDEAGFHTSHLIMSVAHNTGYSVYGPPTGKKLVYRAIANCFAKENYITEEWLIRDNMAIVQQLGFDPHEMARKLARERVERGIKPVHGEITRVKGQTTPAVMPPPPSGAGFDIEDFVRRNYHEVWNWRMFGKIYENYAPNYVCYGPAGRELYGAGDYMEFVLSILASFPDAQMNLDHLYWLGSDAEGYRVAARWTIIGTHEGYGIYGAPTGKRVNIMGLSHHHVKNGKFVQEWTLFDEFMLLQQLCVPRARSWYDEEIPF